MEDGGDAIDGADADGVLFCVTMSRCLHWPSSRIPLRIAQLVRFTHMRMMLILIWTVSGITLLAIFTHIGQKLAIF